MTGNDCSSGSLSDLLAVVAAQGWGSAAGREAVEVMRRACRREAARWTRTAGWLTDEGLAVVWEQMDRLVKDGRFEDAPGLLRVVARRAYAGEAAAAQTGVGSPTTRGLIAAVRSSAASPVDVIDADAATPDADETSPSLVAPPWMRTLAAVLAVQGWAWPVPPLHAVMASAAGVARSGRRSRSVMAAHHTGIPAATWSALDLASGTCLGACTSTPGRSASTRSRPPRAAPVASSPFSTMLRMGPHPV